MSGWLLSVAGIVIIGALTEVLLTDSNVHKFVRSIYAFFLLFTIAQPIPGFFRDTVSSIQTGGAFELDTELIESINSQTAAALQRNAMTALSTAGFDCVIVTVDAAGNSAFKVNAVYVNALGVVLQKQNKDIDIKQSIIEIVCGVVGVSEEVVYYVG